MVAHLTDDLKSFLQQSRADWTRWANEEETKQCETLVEQAKAQVLDLQTKIDHTSQEILAYQLERELHLSSSSTTAFHPEDDEAAEKDPNRIPSQISSEGGDKNLNKNNLHDDGKPSSSRQHQLEQELLELQNTLVGQKNRLQELQHQVRHEQGRVQDSRDIRHQAQESARMTLEQLHKANFPYEQFLGLEFEKAPQNQLRFLFTQLDPSNPDRAFSFTLSVDSQTDLYELHHCEPMLLGDDTHTLVQQLNATCDMNAFVRAMRQAFGQQVIAKKNTPTNETDTNATSFYDDSNHPKEDEEEKNDENDESVLLDRKNYKGES
ncbi:hypothetical protein ACA910_007495 [Epithemia clementina (nom. ined.)]